jgi:hemerythrin-like domain-containing protein
VKPLSTPAVGCEHPLELLDACHERILRFARLIPEIARHLDEHGVDNELKLAARSVIRYFDDAGARHHMDEEQDLFPALLRCASPAQLEALQPLVRKLRQDHVELEAFWSAMRVRLQRLADGTGTTLDLFAAEAFVDGYRRHIELEESELLPLAHRVLDGAALAAMGASMAARRGVVLQTQS